ncbi:hypothetical protein [Shimia sediminis]|uniref:hypothetical protein n=1 Tax=Shimia sediminis TaxID=2497945 RepID=UPI000F8E9E7D|nr:hypothetical protein [Shimia sediminis]
MTTLSRADTNPRQLKLNDVNVDASGLELVAEGRTITKTRAELEQDLADAIRRIASERSDPDGAPADINVTVDKLYLVPLVERAVAGNSYVESTISVTDAASGAIIVAPTTVKGNADTLRAIGALGAVGALLNADVETDYQNAIKGYAKSLIASLQASAAN